MSARKTDERLQDGGRMLADYRRFRAGITPEIVKVAHVFVKRPHFCGEKIGIIQKLT